MECMVLRKIVHHTDVVLHDHDIDHTFSVSNSKYPPAEDNRWNNWPVTVRKLFVEFLGDFLFIFLGSMSVIGSMSAVATTALLGGSLAHGICIAVLIISLGHISGGHFNPAVTIGAAVSGFIHPILAALYVVSQLLGGFVGALFVAAAVNQDTYMRIAGGTTNVGTGNADIGNALITSVITSYFLVQTVLVAACDTDSNVLAPLAIGFSIIVDALAAGQVSGASMNPARSLGPAMAYSIFFKNESFSSVTPSTVWSYQYVYWIGPALGGVIAGVIYKAILGNATKRWLLK